MIWNLFCLVSKEKQEIKKAVTADLIEALDIEASRKKVVQPVTRKGIQQVLKATKKGDIERLKYLIKKNPKLLNIRIPDYNEGTLLHAAVSVGQSKVAKLLISYGVDVNANNLSGRTPLFGVGNIEVARILMSKGAKVNISSAFGETPLHCASARGQKEVVDLLIRKGADVNKKSDLKNTPLHFAAKNGNTQIVKILLSNGAKPNIRNKLGMTPLGEAARIKNKEIIILLRTYGGK